MTAARLPPTTPQPSPALSKPSKPKQKQPAPQPAPSPSPSSTFHHQTLPPLSAMATAQRPVDLFHSLLGTALIEAGVKEGIMAPRSEWPPSVLQRVHHLLSSQVPTDLFSSQVWLGSSSAASHYQRLKRFNSSLAASSALGYLIGLGDRHLDNILFDSNSAQIVHIDLNVCFDKGEKLRVRERVPFRLTRAFTQGSGLRGIEGTFRSALEASLSAFRGRREGLASLLESILFDPRVEWSESREGDANKAGRELDQAASLSLFAIRLDQTRAAIKRHADKILIPALTGEIQEYDPASLIIFTFPSILPLTLPSQLVSGPLGGALLGFIEAHSFLSSVKREAEEAEKREKEATEAAKVGRIGCIQTSSHFIISLAWGLR